MNRFSILIILFFFISCSLEKDNTTLLKLGQKIPNLAIIQESKFYLTTSSLFEQEYLFRENSNIFMVTTDKKTFITFFKPINNSFQTPCGVKVGDTLAEIKKVSKEGTKYMPGWGSFMMLSNGWFAGFGNMKEMSMNKEISPNTKVEFLFKSKYHSSWYETLETLSIGDR